MDDHPVILRNCRIVMVRPMVMVNLALLEESEQTTTTTKLILFLLYYCSYCSRGSILPVTFAVASPPRRLMMLLNEKYPSSLCKSVRSILFSFLFVLVLDFLFYFTFLISFLIRWRFDFSFAWFRLRVKSLLANNGFVRLMVAAALLIVNRTIINRYVVVLLFLCVCLGRDKMWTSERWTHSKMHSDRVQKNKLSGKRRLYSPL